MADQTAAPVAADLYDLGDTGLFPATVPASSPAVAASDAPEPNTTAPPAGDKPSAPEARPRNPDGTFAPAAQAGRHSDDLTRAARAFGIPLDEIESSSSDELRGALKVYQRQYNELVQRRGDERFLSDLANPPRPASGPGDAAAPPGAAPTQTAAAPGFDWGAGADQWDAGLLNLLQRQFESRDARIRELEKVVGEVRGRQLQSIASANTRRLDDAFAKLPDRFHPFLGTKSAAEFTPAEKETMLRRRSAVLGAAGIDVRSFGPEDLARIEKAAEMIYGPAVAARPEPEPARGKPRVSPEEWNGAGLRAPTHRNGGGVPEEAPGRDKAIRNVARKLGDDAAVPDLTGDAELENTLLG